MFSKLVETKSELKGQLIWDIDLSETQLRINTNVTPCLLDVQISNNKDAKVSAMSTLYGNNMSALCSQLVSHLLLDSLFFFSLKIDLYDSGCMFGVVVMLQNKFGTHQTTR